MKIDRILNSKIWNSRIFAFVVCAVFVVLSALYYYGLQCEYPPQPEEVIAVQRMFSHLSLGTDYTITEVLFDTCLFVATKIEGMSYQSVRIFLSLLYSILLSFTVFLCLKPKRGGGTNLYRLPLIALFSVILFPIAVNYELFQWPPGVDLIYEFPFHYHYTARIYALICLVLLMILLQCQEKKRKVIYGILFAVICLYAMRKTDLIYYIVFLAPAAIVVFLYALHVGKLRKYAVYCTSAGMCTLLLSRVFLQSMWTRESVGVYGDLYGGTNWTSIDTLGMNFLNYIKLILINFNIQLPKAPVLSLYSVVYILKIGILIVGYIIVIHIIKCSVTGENDSYQYDFIDEILAWSYILMTGVYLSTDFGSAVIFFRYFSQLTFIMTILLCRNIEAFPKIIGIKWLKEIKYKKELLFIYTFVLCVCSTGKVWTYRVPNGYEPELKAIAEYIENTDYGCAVAPFWLYSQIGALSNGAVMAYQTEEEIKNIYGSDVKVTYIITNNFDNSDIKGDFYDHCNTYEEMCEYYSEPSDIIRYERLQLVIYKDGIQIKE